MGRIRSPQPVKLIVPMLSAHTKLLEDAREALVARFGPTDLVSAHLPFEYTTYYRAELGASLQRQFLSFERLIDPGELAAIKTYSNMLEEEWRVEERRRVNLDPGYLTPAKLVLASTKDYAHRVYIGEGVYAEVTLAYRGGDFRSWPWTYPDYQSESYLCILRKIREIYMFQLKALS